MTCDECLRVPYPGRAVLVDLFLPDGDHLLDTVDGVLAGSEGLGAVG